MGLDTLLTVLFIALKLCGVIDWPWFFVVLPFIVGIIIRVLGHLLEDR